MTLALNEYSFVLYKGIGTINVLDSNDLNLECYNEPFVCKRTHIKFRMIVPSQGTKSAVGDYFCKQVLPFKLYTID